MTLVDKEEKILWEKVDQAEGALARIATCEITRVVLNARAEAHLLKELNIIFRAHPNSLRFEQHVL